MTSVKENYDVDDTKTNTKIKPFSNLEKEEELDNVYHKIVLKTNIKVNPVNINDNINDNLLSILKNKVEGICIKEGYIKPNSVNIISRSIGKITLSIFDGDVNYTINYEAQVCNPNIDDEIICYVQDVNKSTINCYLEDPETSPLNIFLARQHHIDNSDYFKLNKNDKIKIKITGKKYEYLDNNILVFGNLIKKI